CKTAEIYDINLIYLENDKRKEIEDTLYEINEDDAAESKRMNDLSKIGTKDPKYLMPDYINSPDCGNDDDDDLFTLSTKWGKEYFTTHYPSFDRSKSDRDCLFERDFIRETVKKMEPTLRQIYSGECISTFIKHSDNKFVMSIINDLTWIQQDDMVQELILYLMELESDINKKAGPILSYTGRKIVWPEIIASLIMSKFGIKYEAAVNCILESKIPTSEPTYIKE
ncbi:PREDICTED: uncharacterized protein LOC109592758, partial [Amphimedon queenslandica]|uniref:Uncharacterized protein n=2 Tax=Amphimedon queenslandica TaxID=400682 RepID=A0AAN0K3G6_AMPQE